MATTYLYNGNESGATDVGWHYKSVPGTNVVTFTCGIVILYGDYIGAGTGLPAAVLPVFPPTPFVNCKVKRCTNTGETIAVDSVADYLGKQDVIKNGQCIGACYMFQTGRFFLVTDNNYYKFSWECGEITVNYGVDSIKIGPMYGDSDVFVPND